VSYALTVCVKWNGSLVRQYTIHKERRSSLPSPTGKMCKTGRCMFLKKSYILQMHVRFVVLSINQHMLYCHRETTVNVLKFL
jgi:hypothetical protein